MSQAQQATLSLVSQLYQQRYLVPTGFSSNAAKEFDDKVWAASFYLFFIMKNWEIVWFIIWN